MKGLLALCTLACATALAQEPIDPIYDVNSNTIYCDPSNTFNCQDYAYGRNWNIWLTVTATCNNGNPIRAATSVRAFNCTFDAYGDVAGLHLSRPAYVLTPSGWVVRYMGVMEASAYGQAGGYYSYVTWSGYDDNYCDGYRDTSIPPIASPC